MPKERPSGVRPHSRQHISNISRVEMNNNQDEEGQEATLTPIKAFKWPGFPGNK